MGFAIKPWYYSSAVLLLPVFLSVHASTNESHALSAVYRGNHLSLSIPYHADRDGAVLLRAQLLDPEDGEIGQAARTIHLEREGVWNVWMPVEGGLTLEDLVWDRLKFRIEYRDGRTQAYEEIHPMAEVLRHPVMHLICQSSYIAGATAAVRVVVADEHQRPPEGNKAVRIELQRDEQPTRMLYSGRLNERGTADAEFRMPAGLSGDFRLHVVVETAIGDIETTQNVHVENELSVMLTTEKRVYQPTQTIHARTLVLDRADRHASGETPITFEIEDSRGNKVFRESGKTDEYGIASAQFTLADEVNLGTYHLRALIGKRDAPSKTTELAFAVDRYVLPRFKVAVDFNNAKRDYRPGGRVAGSVQANYFFGKPVANSEVAITALTKDVSIAEAAKVEGVTDKDGAFHFDLGLPAFLAGREQNAGSTPVMIEATVKDGSGHSEVHDEGITVSESSLLVTAIPEAGALIPNLENRVYLLASYPDGTPAVVDLEVRMSGSDVQSLKTDNRGIAVATIIPGELREALKVKADDGHGNRTSTTLHMDSKEGGDQVLLRADRTLCKAGDTLKLTLFSTVRGGDAYLDVVKDGQTMVTRDLEIVNGKGEFVLTLTPDMAGTLNLNAYRFSSDGREIEDHRLVFVAPADELKVQAIADAAVYKPGAEATIRFRVTDDRGEGVSAALGLQVVDEAVMALAEKQPGLAKTFFSLEEELLKPRYEIHSFSWPEIIEPTSDAGQGRERAAEALLSASDLVNHNSVKATYGATLGMQKVSEYQRRYRMAFRRSVANCLRRGDNLRDLRDAWGNRVRLEAAKVMYGGGNYSQVRSAGPDGELDTADDLTADYDRTAHRLVATSEDSALELWIEHNRGIENGFASIRGDVRDATGTAIRDAMIHIIRADRTVAIQATNAEGEYRFDRIQPGTYAVNVSAMGFQTASDSMNLRAGDVAILTGSLRVGMVAEVVEVATGAIMIDTQGANLARAVAPFALRALPPLPRASPAAPPPAPLKQAAASAPEQDTHVRSFFPEALYINPEIITDRKGNANIRIPMADSITNWRMAMIASTTKGALGSATGNLKVFQDFFVDLDLPVTITQGDRVSIPVAVYNYTGERGNVKLALEHSEWFEMAGDVKQKYLEVESGHTGGSSFTIEATRIGKFKLTLAAQMDGAANRRDVVVREIEVVPNGHERNVVFNGRLDSQSMRKRVIFPNTAIPEASKILVRLYPGPLSQVVEGMDAILQMPFGCFEQTSSSTYPNVLALNYMKQTGKLTPEVHAKAEGYIATGYQRLLTFEVHSGGFSWFGNAPANKILTAYGLMEFSDMAKVHEVDARVIERTRAWLISQQRDDGSWGPDESFINEGATNRYNSNVVRITAYIAWALESCGYRGPSIEKAHEFLEGHLEGRLDSYTLAVLANFAIEADSGFRERVLKMLLDARVEEGDQVHWDAQETGVYGRGESAAVETTGLAVQALLSSHQVPEITSKALAFLAAKKDAAGTWGTTQATIMALRALLMASGAQGEATGAVEVRLNGEQVQHLTLTQENGDLYHELVLPHVRQRESNDLEIEFKGSGGLAYQIVGSYFLSWQREEAQDPLAIRVAYDRTKLAENETVTATATIKNNLDRTADMVMVDFGIPPGFDLLTDDLDALKEKTAHQRMGRLEKYSITATQAILYFNGFAPKSSVRLQFRLRAKYPIRAQTLASHVYEYYDPSVGGTARPQQVEVTAK